MSFKVNNSEQITLNDRLNNLTERELRFLNNSWAKKFAETIFPMIDELKFSVLYDEENGRPNTPVNAIVGALFLKELKRLTDEQLLESILFDTLYQYALHLTNYDEIPFSDRTLSRFRERLYWHESETGEDIMKEEIERISGVAAEMMGIKGKKKRMDSLMVSSSCKRMGRLELIYTCVSNLVKELVKSGESEKLPEELLKYADESNKNAYCYRLDKDEIATHLEAVTKDALLLYETASSLQGGADDFQLLERLLDDQTENGALKANRQIKPDSLQNPSDEDATFRRKAGKGHQGYTANIVEDCGETGNIITKYEYAVNIKSDTEFGSEVIESLGEQEEKVVLISDGSFASEANFEAAEANNIELVTTNLTGEKPPEIILEFQIEDNEIKACPEGHKPLDSEYNEEKGEYRAHFERATCEACPRREECPVVLQKKKALVKLSVTTINRAVYAEKLSSEEYKDHARTRNGVEGVMSVLRRRYDVDNMPVRGLLRSKMWFGFKIAAINIKRLIAVVA